MSNNHFSDQQIRDFMKAKMPHCPEEHRERVINRVTAKQWEGCTLSRAIGICSHNYIRHELTDYETWLNRHRLERDEARLIVKDEVEEIFDSWLRKKRKRKGSRWRLNKSEQPDHAPKS